MSACVSVSYTVTVSCWDHHVFGPQLVEWHHLKFWVEMSVDYIHLSVMYLKNVNLCSVHRRVKSYQNIKYKWWTRVPHCFRFLPWGQKEEPREEEDDGYRWSFSPSSAVAQPERFELPGVTPKPRWSQCVQPLGEVRFPSWVSSIFKMIFNKRNTAVN